MIKKNFRSCEEVMTLASQYLDGELDEVTHERINRHLQTDPDCAKQVAVLRAVDHFFRQVPEHEAPADFTARAVATAFEDQLRYNMRLGVLLLMVGTGIISSLSLLGYVDVLWVLMSTLLTPGFLAASPTWVVEAWQGIQVAGRGTLVFAEVMMNLMVGPLLIPSLVSLLSALFVSTVLRQQQARATSWQRAA